MYIPASFAETDPSKLYDFIDRLLAAIIGFEIEVDRIEGKWKLNQNHAVERRHRVMQALRLQGDPGSLAIADWMANVE